MKLFKSPNAAKATNIDGIVPKSSSLSGST